VNKLKKTIINIILVVTALIVYYLQSNFFSWFNIAGIMPNLFVILALFIGLFSNQTMGTAYGVGIGLVLDLLLGNKIGIYAVTLGLIGFLAAIFDKNFSKDSRMTIMLMVLSSTVIFETISYLMKYILLSTNLEIINFIVILIIEVIYNLLLTIILYPLIQKFGYYIENEYKGNKILTRYF
jgi:rod shape-determining protein MreD